MQLVEAAVTYSIAMAQITPSHHFAAFVSMSPDITSGTRGWQSSANSLFDRLKSFDQLCLSGERPHRNRKHTGARSVNAQQVEKISKLT